MPHATATIIGAGAMGTALATVLSENKFKVTLWDIETDVVDGINRFHKNPRSLHEVKLDASIKAEVDLDKAVAGRDLVVIAVASRVVREVVGKISGSLARNCVVVTVAKGLEEKSFKTMPEVIYEELGGNFRYQILALSGPTLAHEIGQKKPTAAMLASERSNEYSKRAFAAFSNSWFRVYETRDVKGISLGAVAKNALAVGAGIMSGLKYGSNTYAWVLTEGFRELSRLIWKMGGTEETVYGIAAFGDTIATCFSSTSRNREFGEIVGSGKTVSSALQKVGETVEGVDAIAVLHEIAKKERLNLPILTAFNEVAVERKKADKVFSEMLRNL